MGSLATKLTVDDGVLVSGLGRAGGRLQQFERQSNTSLGRMDAKFTALGRTVTALGTSLIGIFAGSQILRGAATLIDTSTRIQNSLKVAGLAGAELSDVYDELYASAQRNAVPLENLAQLYSRVSLVQKELGASTQEMLKFTDNVALALRVAGTDAQSASGALMQLSQAMGSGIVRSEEFNSILEGALPIAQAAAAGLDEAGGSVAKLRQLVVDGKVTSEAFFRAFEAGSVILEGKVANAELTVSQGFIRLQNVLVDTAGKFNDATGTSKATAGALGNVAEMVEKVGEYLERNEGRIGSFFDAMGGGFAEIEQFKNDLRAALVDNNVGGIGWLDDFLEGTSLIEGRFGLASQQIQMNAADVESQLMTMLAALVGVSEASLLSPELSAQFTGLIDQAAAGEIAAKELQEALVAAGGQDVNFNAIFSISQLIDKLRTARAEAAALASVPAAPGIALQRDEQTLLRDQTVTPKAVKTVSISDYVTPIKAGSSARSGGVSEAEKQKQAVDELIVSLADERAAIGLSATEQRVMSELRRVNIDATSEQGQAIAAMIRTVETEADAFDRMQESLETATGLAQDFASTIVQGFMEGKDASEVLGNAVQNLMGKLAEMALNQAITGLFGMLLGGPMGGMGGSLLGGLFGGGGGGLKLGYNLADGGTVRGPGSATSDSIPAMLSDGEFVVNARSAGKHAALLKAINADRAGLGSIAKLADGGFAMPGGGEVDTPRHLELKIAA
ncbi:MAG: tape measure protein [Devosia sp.]